jgi:hypothetical protein
MFNDDGQISWRCMPFAYSMYQWRRAKINRSVVLSRLERSIAYIRPPFVGQSSQ